MAFCCGAGPLHTLGSDLQVLLSDSRLFTSAESRSILQLLANTTRGLKVYCALGVVMRLARGQLENFRRVYSGSLAEISSSTAESIVNALGLSSQRCIATSAPAHRFRGFKDPVSHVGDVTGAEPKPYLVDKFFGSEIMSSSESRQKRINEVISTYQRDPADTGSTEVQVAILTVRILAMAEHMKVHRKDFSSRLGLEGMLAQRRKLLQYLRRADFDAYAKMLSALGLKDRYMKQDRLTLRRSAGAEGYKS